MRILYIGDIMGDVGLELVRQVLPGLRKDRKIDLVVAQAENVTDGKGLSLEDFATLKALGIDFATGGNWTLEKPDIYPALNDPDEPAVRPANYPVGTPGKDYKILTLNDKKFLIVSILGSIVGKDSDKPRRNPLKTIDDILESTKNQSFEAVIVNFHGDYSSEKVVIGHYLDGRASLVVGDHWHVPTADAQVLSGGTAHITDVGMTGSLDSSLGVKYDTIIGRWRNDIKSRNILEQNGRRQFNAVLVETRESTIKAKSIEHVRLIFD